MKRFTTLRGEHEVSAFLDSNIVLYAYGDDRLESESAIAIQLLADYPSISTQVVNECSHVMRRKLVWQPAKVAEELEILLELTKLHTVGINDIRLAWRIAARYGFSHYDSLIVASAVAAGCEQLLSEDMQHGQQIEQRLTIVNPFSAPQTL